MNAEKIGFVGLGRMGLKMALRLINFYPVYGTDTAVSIKQSVQEKGVTWVDDSISLARICRHIFVVAGTEDDVTEIIFGERGLVSGIDSDTTVVICATVRPTYMRALAERLSKNKFIKLLDCPIARGEMAQSRVICYFLLAVIVVYWTR